MEDERDNVLTVIVGASRAAERLRRSLIRSGLPQTGAAGHMRGLRRRLAAGPPDAIVLCVALDATTLDRHGPALQTLLGDLHGMSGGTGSLRSVGLLPGDGLTPRVAEIGCDLYVANPEEARAAIEMLHEDLVSFDLERSGLNGRSWPDAGLVGAAADRFRCLRHAGPFELRMRERKLELEEMEEGDVND
jgi:hypothetical protein